MVISIENSVHANNTAFSAEMDNDLILFDPEAGVYYGSGPVGAKIWEFVVKGAVVSDICKSLMDDFEVDKSTCETEVLAFLHELQDRELLTVF